MSLTPTPITVTNTYPSPVTGEVAKGSVTFELSHALLDPLGNVIVPAMRVTEHLDATGSISVSLVPTNHPDTLPENVTYEVVERLMAADKRTYSISVPYNAAGGTVCLADLAPVDDTEVVWATVVPEAEMDAAIDSAVLVETNRATAAEALKADAAATTAALATKASQAALDSEAAARQTGDTTTLASAQAYADAAAAALVDSAPGTLDTLNELAAALGDDPNLAATLATQIGAKASQVALDAEEARAVEAEALRVPLAQKGAADGVAELDRGASVPVAQTPPARVGWQEDLPEDGPLPAGWVDASTLTGQELWWDAIEVLDGAFVTPDPDTGPILQLTNSGARAAAYRDFGPGYGDEVRVEVWWSGDHPYEGTPLIHVNEDADEFGIGVWPIADLLGSPFWSYGYAGRDPSQFVVTATEAIVGHTDGTPRLMSLRSSGGFVSLYVDDVLVIGPQAIPANLVGSTKHGIAIDINQDPSRTPNVPAVQAPFRVLLDGAAPASTAEVGLRLPLTGGTLSGPLVVERDPGEGSTTVGWADDNTPTVALRKHEDDTQPSAGIGFILGLPAITWGPGGSTIVDALLFRSAAATLTLAGKILTATDATAATELVNKRTAEGIADAAAEVAVRRPYTRPAAALAETIDRRVVGNASAGLLSSGRLSLFAIVLPEGLTINDIAFLSGATGATTPTNQWFALYNASRAKLAVTADATTAAWAATTLKTLALSAPFVTTYEGLYYLGIMVAAATVPTLANASTQSAAVGLSPVLAGSSTSGLTTPATAPTTAAAISAQGAVAYGYVS